MNKLDQVAQDFKNGRMAIPDIEWVIKELYSANERIKDLEGTAERWMKQSISDLDKLKAATERIKYLEGMIDNGLGWEDMKNDI